MSLEPLLPVVEVTAIYKRKPSGSSRVLDVIRQFSLGAIEDYKVFENFRLEWNDPVVIYITGESGGGKSTLLRAIKNVYGDECIDLNSITPEPDEVLCESVGNDLNEALFILNKAGLGEAWLFVEKYKHLSDGQKYRYRIAKALWIAKKKKKKAIVADEWCSMLDRINAKVVSYLAQKLCRAEGISLIVATAHEDLLEDLNPDIFIIKPFMKPPAVRYFTPEQRFCSLWKDIRIEKGSRSDYNKLEVYHYAAKKPAFVTDIFRAKWKDNLVGCIVYSTAALDLRARREVFGSSLREEAKRKEIKRIARVIVVPRFRGIGLGVQLVKQTLRKVNAGIVETYARMAVYNPFFEKAGMQLGAIYQLSARNKLEIKSFLGKFGVDESILVNIHVLRRWLEEQKQAGRLEELEKELAKVDTPRQFSRYFRVRRLLARGKVDLDVLTTYLFSFSIYFTKTYYYFWIAPEKRLIYPVRRDLPVII